MDNEICIKDNFLPKSFLNHLRNHLFSREIEWTFCKNATGGENNERNSSYLEDYYFSHTAYVDENPPNRSGLIISPHFNIVQPLLYFIEDKFNFEIINLFRINFTFITQRHENIVTKFHVDSRLPHYVAIFYLNTCNGPTLIEDKKVDFVENRLVLFDGKMQHAAVTQSDTPHRINIVMNFHGVFF